MAKKNIEVVEIPTSLEEVSEFIAEISEAQGEIDKLDAELNDKINKLKIEAVQKMNPLETKIHNLFQGVYAFAQVRREELTDSDKRKTVETPTGKFNWKINPASIELSGDQQEIIAKLKELGLERFIRIKEELDKELLLKEPKVVVTVEGISVKQEETFSVKPDKVKTEFCKSRRLKTEIPMPE